MKKVSIVIDLGFGDSGKGLCVDWLASKSSDSSLVIRFSGGHQVGHTVSVDGISHTFSNFGAGTLRAVPTFYAEHCVVFPPAMLVEAERLPFTPPTTLFHPRARVCTLYDIAYNCALDSVNKHGSCGVGFGATNTRHAAGVTLFAVDLANNWVLTQKLAAIAQYYADLCRQQPGIKALYEQELEGVCQASFVQACGQAQSLYRLAQISDLHFYSNWIFEGSQGVMLDAQHGIFPHVTPSSTTSQNAWRFLSQLEAVPVDMYYLSRCYQTRHGNGPMSSSVAVDLIRNEGEANQYNEYQGEFRCRELDLDLLEYALWCERSYHPHRPNKEHILFTCLDQRPDYDTNKLLHWADTHACDIKGSWGPSANGIRDIP